MKPIVQPLQINVESNLETTNSLSSNKTGLLTEEIDQHQSSIDVTRLIHSFQENSSHDLEQTVLMPQLQSSTQSINHSENVSFSLFFFCLSLSLLIAVH